MADVPEREPYITERHLYLLIAASVMTWLLVTMGGIVCATQSGTGCPDWPRCYGSFVPPSQANAIIEYTHRLTAALAGVLILACAVVSWRKARSIRWVTRPLVLAVPFLLAVAVFGALTVLVGLPRGLAAVDLGSALIVLALVVTSSTVALARRDTPDMPDRLSAGSTVARLSLAALAAVFAVHVSGILVAGKGSLTGCLAWPMWRLRPGDLAVWSQVARLLLAAVAAYLVVAVVAQVRRSAPNRLLGAAATLLAATLLVEMLLGAVMLVVGASPYLLVIYVAAATLLWASLVVVAVLACAAAASAPAGAAPRAPL